MAEATDNTRRRLLDTAGEVFGEKGFRAATVREICRRAGANVAAVNYHFGDKESLYVAAVQHSHACDQAEPLPNWPVDTPPARKLRDYVRGMLTRLLDPNKPVWHTQLMAREMAQPTKACEALVESYIRKSYNLLNEILTELLPKDTAEADRHLTAFGIVGQCLYFKIGRPIAIQLVGEDELATYDIARLTDHITRFTLAALEQMGTSREDVSAEPTSECAGQ